MCPRFPFACVLCVFLASAAAARAQSLPAAGSGETTAGASETNAAVTADALFQHAKDAMSRGDLATACAAFAESDRLDPAAGTRLNWADCEERSGKLSAALARAHDARDLLPASDFRIAFTEALIARLAARVPRLVLRFHDAPRDGTQVIRDGVVLGAASLGVEVPVDPGKHTCVVRAPDHEDASIVVMLREGEARTIELTMGPRVKEGPLSGPSSPFLGARARRTAGLVLGSAGVVGIGIGAVLGIVAKSTYDDAVSHCPRGPTSCDAAGVIGGQSAHGQAVGSTAAFAAGGVLLAGGALLYFTAPKLGRVSAAPTVGTAGVRLGFEGSW